MASGNIKRNNTPKKKTRQGRSTFTKWGAPGPQGQSKHYRKKYRGQGN